MKAKIFSGLAGILVAATMLSGAAMAQSTDNGVHAGSILIRGRLIDVMPQNGPSNISAIGGQVSTDSTLAPEVDFSYFLTDNWAMELIAATTKHNITATNTSLGGLKVGSTWVLPPALTVQYHFLPKSSVNPYLGAGLNYTLFYNTKAAGGTVTNLKMTNNIGEVIQAGVDFDLTGRWFANLDVKQIFLNTRAKINGSITAKTALNPTVFGAGFGYRF